MRNAKVSNATNTSGHAGFVRRAACAMVQQACMRTTATLGIGVASLLISGIAQAQRIPVNALPSGGAGQPFVAGSSTIRAPQIISGGFNAYQVNGNTATITQTSATGILRWATFDIGANATVNANLPSATAVLLNKVDGGAYMNKTLIEGMLNSNGQVYIYNPNGIIFGRNSQINVNSLVATSLKIDDNRFLAGMVAPNTAAFFNADSTLGFVPGAVEVEGAPNAGGGVDRATINAATGGRILLVAPSVINNGNLNAADGQVALAAGGRVFLASPTDLRMRGLLVEVSNDNLKDAGGNLRSDADGRLASTATNDALGKILVGRGNASIVGLAVNQNGNVSATTSVQVNGSIYLRARDGVGASKSDPNAAPVATNGGSLVLGANSVTEVRPTLDDAATTAGTTTFNNSQVDLSGATIHFQQGASIVAPGGDVSVAAQVNPSNSVISPGALNASGRVYMEAGSSIDVSGTTTTQLAMEQNVIQVQLRGSELADSPLQRDSVVRGQTISIDIRKGTPLGNVSGYLALVEQNVGQRTAAGGTVKFSSDGDVIINQGASVNVSGGKVTYKDGYVATTQLTSGGSVYDISAATPDRIYDGIIAAAPGPRNAEAGYAEGRSAGTIFFNAPNLVLRGSLQGAATPGSRQRDVTSASYPAGGTIIIGKDQRFTSDQFSNFSQFNYLGTIDLGGTSTSVGAAAVATPAFGDAWNAGNTLLTTRVDLNTDALTAAGFSKINAYTQGNIVVSRDIKLGPAGELRLAAQNDIQFNAGLASAGGNLEALSATSRVAVADGANFDVAGLWTNDRGSGVARDAQGNATATLATAGGTIALTGRSIDVGDGVAFDVSGGAWQNGSGKISGGSGGSVALVATRIDNTTALGTDDAQLTLGQGIDFRAYGLASGGSLKLSGRNVMIGAAAADNRDLGLQAGFFQQGGFAKYDIGAAGNLTVAGGTVVQPLMNTWMANSATTSRTSGRMRDAFDIGTLPLAGAAGARGASSINLSARAELVDGEGRLWLQPGASIVTDPGASVKLSAGRQLTVDAGATVVAPGGSVSLLLTPTPSVTTPYSARRSIWLGANSSVDVSGTSARLWNDNRGVTNGDLLDGGRIFIGSLDSNGNPAPAAGYVVAEQGSRLGVSGVTATMSVASRYGVATGSVASAGGSIDIRAREGMLLEGAFSGAGGDGSVAGGSIALTLDTGSLAQTTGYPTDPRNLIVSRVKPNAGTPAEGIVPVGLVADQAIVGQEGKGIVLAAALNNGGFDRIGLKSQDVLTFDTAGTSVGLTARAAITADAPLFKAAGATTGSTVNLTAANVQIGNTDWQYQTAAAANAPSGGAAVLNVNARNIDLVGASVAQGFGQTSFNSSGDIRFVGQVNFDLSASLPSVLPVIHAYGSFATAGTMNFTATQVYPTTLSEFTLTAANGNNIGFYSNGVTPAMPLSAAGTLQVNAANIVQNGVVRAPFGSISLNADDSLSFGAGSLTSVAGEGLLPLGRINNGRDWLYDFGNGNTITLNDTSASNGVNLPEKSITSKAARISVQSGATLDLAGGGELYGYEFTPGPGGSRDVLAKATGAVFASTFAIIPGYTGEVAPRDYQYSQDSGLRTGDRIYLSGSPGVPAGFYTLLPAHYALLPGAYAVTAAAGTRDMVPAANFAKPDGTWLVSGKLASLDSVGSRSSGFIVSTGAQVRTQSEFVDYRADSFFTAGTVPRQQDGGHVAFAATQAFSLQGTVKLGGADGGARGIADISAPAITVVADASQDTGSALKLVASDLVAMGADSLLLGGLRSTQVDGDHISNVATSVTLANNAGNALTGAEIILAANDTVAVNGGSAITSAGVPSRSQRNLVIDGTGAGADGALLRVSSGSAVTITRNAPPGSKGTLDIAAGAIIGATGSLNLDATSSLVNNSQLGLGNGTALGLGANRISLGDASPLNVAGLRFDNNALGQLSSLASIALTSYSTIDIYGSVNLGSSATRNLTLTAAGIQNYGGAADTTNLSAVDTLRFGNSSAVVAAPAGTAAGNFAATARDIQIGSNSFALNGYTNATLTASREVRADGKAGVLSAQNNLTVKAGRITASSNADAAMQAGNTLVLTQLASPDAPSGTLSLGGKLTFSGNTVVSDAVVVANAGQINLSAAQGVNVTGGTLDASGQSIAFGSTYAYAPGGRINLDGGGGPVQVGAPATLDVSAVGSDAGTLSFKANNSSVSGVINIDGTLKGSATAGVDGKTPLQGNAVVDVDQLASGFGVLNQKLNAGGFSESRQFRVRASDVTLATGENIVAHDVLISADNGNVTIGGAIDASGSKGGSIQIFAGEATRSSGKGNITLQNTASLQANAVTAATSAAGSSGDGGRVLIGTSSQDGLLMNGVSGNSSISIDAAGATQAQINVAGAGAGQSGTVTFRAPRVGSAGGSDVAINGLGNAIVTGSNETVIEAYNVYTGTQISAANGSAANLDARTTGTMYTQSNSFIGNKTTILTRLDPASVNGVRLRAGIEVRSTGSLTVNVNETAANPQDRGWDFRGTSGTPTWRFGGEPGVLTLRAAGDLIIKGSISDGFIKPTLTTTKFAMPDWALDPSGGASWSYRLTGGADTAAANPLGVRADNIGNVLLTFQSRSFSATDQPVALVRTGNGRIDVAAGNDVTLDKITGNGGTTFGATVYTAGQHANTVTGVVTPKAVAFNPAYAGGSSANVAAEFATGGGAISIFAANNVNGAATDQLINNWLFRRGRTNTDGSGTTVFARAGSTAGTAETQQTAWWSRYDFFNQGVATFGGGDISVTAGRGNITDLSVNAATNGEVSTSTAAPTSLAGATLIERGGGDISVRAGGDIKGGTYYVQKGQAVLRAGGAVTTSSRTVTVNSVPNIPLRTVLALGDASISIIAGGDVNIESVFNPTQTRQSSVNAAAAGSIIAVNAVSGLSSLASANYGYFSTYGENSGVSLTSVNGNVVLGSNAAALVAASGAQIATPLAADTSDYQNTDMFRVYPGTLNVTALRGDISYERGFTLAPSAKGQLNLLAGGSVKSAFSSGSEHVVMSDLDPASLPGVLSPRALSVKGDINLLTYAQFTDGLQFHTASSDTSNGLHGSDNQPVRIIALNGDVSGDVNAPQTFILPKRAEIIAGNDIRDLGFKIQNVNASDVTLVQAGRDFIDTTSPVQSTAVSHQVSGPGRVDIEAGRNVDLGNSNGLRTRGNLDNPYLSDTGAGINIVAGAHADYAGFVRSNVSVGDLPEADQVALITYMRGLQPSLPASLSAADALTAFNALPSSQSQSFLNARKPLLNTLFFTKTRLASQAIGGGAAKDLSAFDGIIASLFPATSITGGDVNVFGSQIKTERGGDVSVLTPGGSVFAGLSQQPAWLAAQLKTNPGFAANLGVTTIRGGALQSLVKDDFLVNQGRVFTLGGGDITLISQYGNIDAGRGTKTAVSAPPPLITTDAKGNTVVDISGSISGSGIATLRTSDDVPASNVYPVAPRGVFDAGDAGVRSTGTVNITAQTVLNAGNISAGSGVSGAKTADASALGGAVSAPATAPATKAENFGAPPAPSAAGANSLTVELIGLPGQNGGSQENVTQEGQNQTSGQGQ
jgi:filamentous hemagglutinin family protein